jgi:hypothetical protein
MYFLHNELILITKRLSGSVGVGVDNVWKQRKFEARKMLENGDEYHMSGTRFVSPIFD